MDDWRWKLGARVGALRPRGPGESKRALLIAATACDAVAEMLLKKVPVQAIGAGIVAGVVHALALGSHGLLLCRRVEVSSAGDAAVLAHVVREQGSEDLLDAILAADLDAALELDPGALVLSVAALDLLVVARLDLLLEDLGALALVDTGDLEDLGRVQVRVVAGGA